MAKAVVVRRPCAPKLLAEFFPGWHAVFIGEPLVGYRFARIVVISMPTDDEERRWFNEELIPKMQLPDVSAQWF